MRLEVRWIAVKKDLVQVESINSSSLYNTEKILYQKLLCTVTANYEVANQKIFTMFHL